MRRRRTAADGRRARIHCSVRPDREHGDGNERENNKIISYETRAARVAVYPVNIYIYTYRCVCVCARIKDDVESRTAFYLFFLRLYGRFYGDEAIKPRPGRRRPSAAMFAARRSCMKCARGGGNLGRHTAA